MGFFGNDAPDGADLNLLLQIVSLFMLIAGAYAAKIVKFGMHRRLMVYSIFVEFGAFMFWMGPSLFYNIGALRTFDLGPLITVTHAATGLIAVALAVSSAFHSRLLGGRLRRTMRTTFITWAVAAALGFAFYAYYYVLR